MPWRTMKNGKDEICMSVFILTVDPQTGKSELAPGPFYTSLKLSPNDPNMHEAAIREAYREIVSYKTMFERDAAAEGVVLDDQ